MGRTADHVVAQFARDESDFGRGAEGRIADEQRAAVLARRRRGEPGRDSGRRRVGNRPAIGEPRALTVDERLDRQARHGSRRNHDQFFDALQCPDDRCDAGVEDPARGFACPTQRSRGRNLGAKGVELGVVGTAQRRPHDRPRRATPRPTCAWSRRDRRRAIRSSPRRTPRRDRARASPASASARTRAW